MFEPPVAGNPRPSGDVMTEPRPLAPGTGGDPLLPGQNVVRRVCVSSIRNP